MRLMSKDMYLCVLSFYKVQTLTIAGHPAESSLLSFTNYQLNFYVFLLAVELWIHVSTKRLD